MPIHKKKAVLLIRVSDPRQEREGLSLDNQESVLRRYAAEQNLDVVKEYRFQESADLKIRRRFHEMVSYVKSRPTLTCIVGYRVDRMTRNFHDHVLLDELRLNHEKELHFVHDRLVIGPQTIGKDIHDWDTKVFLAKMYLNRLKEDATVSAAFKVSRGEWPAKAPFGYRNVRVNERSTVVPDPIEAKIVADIFGCYATGSYSQEQVRSMVSEGYQLSLSKGKLHQILTNPFYYGEMRFKGKLYPHNYTRLISHAVFEETSEVRRRFEKTTYKYAGLDFLYRGVITCADCGCAVTPEQHVKGSGILYSYYHCTEYHGAHSAKWMREEQLTDQLQCLFDQLTIPHDQLKEALALLKESDQSRKGSDQELRKRMQARETTLHSRAKVLYEDRLDGLLSKDSYILRAKKIDSELHDIELKFKDVEDAESRYYQTASSILSLCSRVGELFRRGKQLERRLLIKLVLQNCKLKEKTLLWELNSPFDAVFSHGGRSMWRPLTTMFLEKSIPLSISDEALDSVSQLLQ